MIENQQLSNFQPSDLARKMSLVLTDRIEAGNLTVAEVVTLGRTPYTGWLGRLTSLDYQKINQALTATELTGFKNKRIHELSDGERQKVMLARALAQDTKLILLDEPTAHLDLPSRVEMMHLLHSLARETGKAILLSTHELDLALQASDKLWLMQQNGKLTTGIPEDLVLNGTFETTFAKTGFYFDKSSGTFSMPKRSVSLNLKITGDPDLVFWTIRALKRESIGKKDDDPTCHIIAENQANDTFEWRLIWRGETTTYHQLEFLITAIKFKSNE